MESIAPWNNGLNVVKEYMPRKAIDVMKAIHYKNAPTK